MAELNEKAFQQIGRAVKTGGAASDSIFGRMVKRLTPAWSAESLDWADDADWARLQQEPLRARAQLRLAVLFLLLLVLWAAASKRLLGSEPMNRQGMVLLATAVMPLGILLTATKIPWHYAALQAPMSVGVSLAVAWLCRSRKKVALAGFVSIGSAIWIGLAAKDSEFNSEWTGLLFGATLVLSLTVMLAWPGETSRRLGIAGTVAVSMSIATLIGTEVEFARKSPNEWSFLKQSLLGLIDEDLRCGRAAFIELEGSENLSAVQAARESGLAVRVPMPIVLQNPCFDMPASNDGSWAPAFGGAIFTESATGPNPEPLHPGVIRRGCAPTAGPGNLIFPTCFGETYPPESAWVDASRSQ